MAGLPLRRCGRCQRKVRGKCAHCRPSELRTQSKADLFYATTEWRKLRRAVLDGEPLCRHCCEAGRTTAATDVDHILDRRDRPDLSLDFANLQPLCKSCHSRKTGQTRAAKAAGISRGLNENRSSGSRTGGGHFWRSRAPHRSWTFTKKPAANPCLIHA